MCHGEVGRYSPHCNCKVFEKSNECILSVRVCIQQILSISEYVLHMYYSTKLRTRMFFCTDEVCMHFVFGQLYLVLL